MSLRLRPFPADSAGVVSGWARTDEEVLMWCSLRSAPVPPAQINAWAREDWAEPFGLYRDGQLVAYGELWTDDGEAETELGRLIVAPGERGQGLGRRLAAMLAGLARSRYPRVFLRVHPDNIAAVQPERFDPVLAGPGVDLRGRYGRGPKAAPHEHFLVSGGPAGDHTCRVSGEGTQT